MITKSFTSMILLLVASQCNCFDFNISLNLGLMPAPDLPPMGNDTTTTEAPTTPASTTTTGPTTTAANPCTKCSTSALGGATPVNPVTGVDANGCSTVSFECQAKPGGQVLMQFNSNQGAPANNKATLVCNANKRWEYQPGAGLPNREITEVHCLQS